MCIEERIDSQHMPISSVLKCVHGVVLNHDFKPFFLRKAYLDARKPECF